MSRIRSSLRNHLPFIIIVPLLIIVMTWPTIVYVFDTDTVWIPGKTGDLYFKIWDVWYARQVLEGRADFLYTDLQFFPRGMSLAFHQISIPHVITVALLQTAMQMSNAFNLGYLLMLLANAASTYILLLFIFRDSRISVLGSVVVGVSPHFVFSSSLPDLTLMAMMPLALYFFLRSVSEERLAFALFSGLAAGVSAFVSMFMFVCTLLTLGIYGCFLALPRWRNRGFWLQLAILLCVFGSVSMIRIAPMIMDRDAFAEAAGKNADASASSDILAFLVSSSNPTVSPLLAKAIGVSLDRSFESMYLGYAPLSLVLVALAASSLRRQTLPWLVILVLFLLLRLGETLTVNAVRYPNVPLPKPLLDQVFPILFSPFWYPTGWQVGVVLSIAVLACYGLSVVVQRVSKRHAKWLIMALVALTAFEYYAPLEGRVIDESQLRFIEWLKTEEQDSIRLINLPMGRRYSKIYSFYQSIAGYPTVEGVANRTLAESYSYIDADPLLSEWRNHHRIFCMPATANAINEGLNQLFSDGFTHIVIHRGLPQSLRTPISYLHAKPAYEDDSVTIYRLQDMLGSCRSSAILRGSVSRLLQDIEPYADVRGVHRTAVLSIHPSEDISLDMERLYARIMETERAVIPLTVDDLENISSVPREQHDDIERVISRASVALLIHDPQATPPDLLQTYTAWIARHYRSCGQAIGTDATRVEYFAKSDVPCELLTSDDAFEVKYDNNATLANTLLRFDGERLDLHLLWGRLPGGAYSVSLQIFDAADTKVASHDRVIGSHAAPNLRLDLSRLESGAYTVKLIVYVYETGVSVPGVVSGMDTRFDRELEIGSLTIE